MAIQPMGIVGLGARVHIFVQPRAREAFTSLFRDVLACDVTELDFGLEHPIHLVQFGNDSRFSVEFTELAPPEHDGDVLAGAIAVGWLAAMAILIRRSAPHR
jgi:hypothetical protein